MHVALDFDSTLWPILTAMGFRYEQCVTWEHLAVLCGGHREMEAKFATVMRYEHMRKFPMFPGAAQHLQRLHRRGVQFDVMTQRPDKFSDDVARMLTDARIPYRRLDCSMQIDKVALCLQRGIGVLVDDHPVTMRRAVQAGLLALTLSYPYNQRVAEQLGVLCAPSWAELGTHLDAALDDSLLAA